MTKTLAAAFLTIVALVGPATSAHAQLPAQPFNANRPAASLLLPYFEVNLDDPAGMTTLFSVNNSSATAVLAHVTLWSDLGMPVFAFNVYLTGYDMQTINLRDILVDGVAPRTASAGQDFGNPISPQGPLSQDINFASCTGQLPPPAIPAALLAHMRASLTGQASAINAGRCVGRNLGQPGVARGYVTVDTVNNCTLRFPGDPGYFGFGGTGDATNQNVLYGDYQYLDRSADFAAGDALVHLRASATEPDTSVPGKYTFYGRLVNWLASDNREPLSTTFATRFVAAKEYKQENRALLQQILPPATELIVWRDPKVQPASFSCSSAPAWFPLNQQQIMAFDEQENPELVSGQVPFPAATQRVTVASSTLPVSLESGWMRLDLNTTSVGQVPGLSTPGAAQAWVTVLQRVYQGPTGGRYDVGFRAIRLDSASQPNTYTLPEP